MEDNGHHCPGKAIENEERHRINKQEEILVVPFADAVIYPGTVVVKFLQKWHKSKKEKRDEKDKKTCVREKHTQRETLQFSSFQVDNFNNQLLGQMK